MADLYSVIPGLQPSAQDVLEAELLAKQILEAKYPTLDLREGTGLRDLLIRPLAVFVALANSGINHIFTQNRLNDVDDTTSPDLVDSILSNWFLTRKIGTKSVISSRLYFSRRKNVSISTDISFSTDNVLRFYPVESATYAAEGLVFDSFSNEYYLDVDLIAEKEGSTYNIGQGSLLYFSNFDPYFLRAEINYLREASIESESNTQFVKRAETAISTRNLINEPSVDANLREAFNYIKRLVTVGMGHPDMFRDQIKAVFEPEDPRYVSAISYDVGTGRTMVTLNDHRCITGQTIQINAATPGQYNGLFVATVVDNNTLYYYNSGGNPGPATILPRLTLVHDPILVHNGGMVDVYCSDTLASAVVQVTLDETGKAHLTGPIYDITRSSISGGTDDDTAPQTIYADIINISVDGTSATVSTSAPHEFRLSNPVTVSGVIQEKVITSMSGSGTSGIVTINCTAHGNIVGDIVYVTGNDNVYYNDRNYVVNRVVSANSFECLIDSDAPSSSMYYATMKLQFSVINGTFDLNSYTENSFSFNLRETTSAVYTGTPTVSGETPYVKSLSKMDNRIVTGSSILSGKCNISVTPSHGLLTGRYITISNASNPLYNGYWRIEEITKFSQIAISIPSTITTSLASGATISSVIPWEDFGFSQRQDLVVDMGIERAGQTASFEIKYFQYLDSIQEYLDSSNNRVLCADYLARGFNFYHISAEITSYNGPAPNVALVNSIIESYLAELAPGDMLVVSDMVAKLRLNGIVNIQNPPLITYKKYTRDLVPVQTGIITDILDPDDSTNVFLVDSVTTKATNIDPNTLVIS